jgi:glycogen operon protein
MLLSGDEAGRTQHGNNNGYCQDNEISWTDWAAVDEGLLEFTRRMIALRREHPVLRRRRWFQGRDIRGTVDLGWFKPDGTEMTGQDWDSGAATVGVYLNGDAITDRDRRGQRVSDDSFLLLFNGHDEPVEWTLPEPWGGPWELMLDTSDTANAAGAVRGAGSAGGATTMGGTGDSPTGAEVTEVGKPVLVAGRCVVALRRQELPA